MRVRTSSTPSAVTWRPRLWPRSMFDLMTVSESLVCLSSITKNLSTFFSGSEVPQLGRRKLSDAWCALRRGLHTPPRPTDTLTTRPQAANLIQRSLLIGGVDNGGAALRQSAQRPMHLAESLFLCVAFSKVHAKSAMCTELSVADPNGKLGIEAGLASTKQHFRHARRFGPVPRYRVGR
jgi:hypothetical protein